MTRVRDLIVMWNISRARQVKKCKSDTVSFEAFCNEKPSKKRPTTKESSLSNDIKIPCSSKEDDYIKFSSENDTNSKCLCPSFVTILLVIVLLGIFLVLPIIYLFDCLGFTREEYNRLTHPHKHQRTIKFNHENVIHPVVNDLPPQPKPDYNLCSLKNDEKFDCYPEDGGDREKCESRGCCWVPIKQHNVPLNVPYCYYPPNYETYRYTNISETAFGLVAFLKRNYQSAYKNDVEVIKMIVKYENENRLHVKLVDPSQNRFEPPYPEVPIVDKATTNLTYLFHIDSLKVGFKVIRKSDQTIIFDSSGLTNLIFSDKFLQISGKLPSSTIYGLGEHRSHLLLPTNWQRYIMFNHDLAPTEDRNSYGTHPFYLAIEPSGKNSHGVFLLNSNAMDVILQPTPAITFRPIGGVLDFYFFLGPSPSEVVSQYMEVIGKPFMPPYWALGFHLCRFGYKTLNETNTVMQRNIDAGIPLDTQWNDLDYMNDSNDFTYDHVNFKGLPQFITKLHNRGMHYIPLIDPGVSASEVPGTYPPFDKGIEMDIFVKNSSGQPFIGKVWNRASTVWPDFTHPKTVDYWTLMLQSMHDSFSFDGAWIDMNEPSNFLSGAFNGCPNSTLDNPPYLPAVDGGALNYKTMCMNSQHYIGLHYDVHNLYGFTEAIVTSFALAEIRGKRPMVISRSTFPGHGHYAGHWSGDVESSWYDLKYSIPQLLSFSMFGIPLVGADICGFNGNTTAPLCNRWSQLGAFYPFSRNHNTDDGIDQDPVALGPLVVASTKKALTVRYSLLPYLYTLFWSAHVQGDTVARPLFFEFFNDSKTYDIDTQFLWGSAIMIVPVLDENAVSVSAYFPSGIWYDYYSKSPIISTGNFYNLSAPLDTIPVIIRGGNVIPQQTPLPTTTASRKSNIQLLAASDEDGQGNGKLFWDDGDSLNTVEERRYSQLNFVLKKGELTTEIVWWGFDVPNLGSVVILGVDIPVTAVYVNQVEYAFEYDSNSKYLSIQDLNLSFKTPFKISWN